jgi:hypothetical protein
MRMSVQTMAAVWKGSTHSGSALLMMLAIADFSDDKGHAFPAVSTLAEKTRMKPRNANYLLADLQASGELDIKIGAGRNRTNLYRIRLDRLQGLQSGAGVQPSAGVQTVAGLHHSARRAAPQCSTPLHPSADKPSLNHQEPPDTSLSRPAAPKLPNCPHRDLIAMFAAKVPDLPKPRMEMWINSKDAEAMSARWKWILMATKEDGERYATNALEAVEWFRRFFVRVSESDFLTGRGGKFSGCHLGWLMKKDNFNKVVQGNYENRGAA